MSKVKNSEDNVSAIREIEGKILEKLYTQSNQQSPLISDNELREILTETMDSSNFNIALEDLILGGFVSRIGYNEYQITMNGNDEHLRRTNADVLF